MQHLYVNIWVAFLPIIRSKSELDDFISLVTFSDYVLAQEKIYIGLYNQTEWQSTDPVAFQMTSLQSFMIELLVEELG